MSCIPQTAHESVSSVQAFGYTTQQHCNSPALFATLRGCITPDFLQISTSLQEAILLTTYISGIPTHPHKHYKTLNLSPVSVSPTTQKRAKSQSVAEKVPARIWDAKTGKLERTLQRTDETETLIHSIAFSPDGTRLAAGDGPDTISIWDTATAEHKHELKGHNE